MSRCVFLHAALLPPVPLHAYWTPQRIVAAFCTFRRQYRRWPRRRELAAQYHLPSATTFYERFHSLTEARQLAEGGTHAPGRD